MMRQPNFKQGDSLSREFIDGMANAVKELQTNSIQGVSGGGAKAGGWIHIPESDKVRIRNNSGSDCNAFDVLGIDGSFYDPATQLSDFKQGDPILKGITPTTAAHTGKFAILMEPIADGFIGQACIFGVCQVQINVVSADDQYADVKNSSKILQSAATGSARILYKQSGTGTKWAIVAFGSGGGGSDPNTYFKVSSTYTAGTSSNPASVNYCNAAGTATGATGSETIPTLEAGTVISTSNVIVKVGGTTVETPMKVQIDTRFIAPYLQIKFGYRFQKFSAYGSDWETVDTATRKE